MDHSQHDNQGTRADLRVVLYTIIYGSTFVSSLSTFEPASDCTSLVLSGHCWRRYPPPSLVAPVSRSLVWFSSVGSLENCHRVEQFLWQLYHMTHTLIEKHISWNVNFNYIVNHTNLKWYSFHLIKNNFDARKEWIQ